MAEAAGISLPTIKRIEREPGAIPGTRATAKAIESAFTKARIEFTYDRDKNVTRLKAVRK